MDKLMNILINNLTPFNILIESIPAGGLPKNVSDLLNISNLSKHKGSKVELSWKFKYQVKIIGYHSRFLFQSHPLF